jgi:hypothetical protein
MAAKHYHWHITFRQGRKRLTDTTPFTTEAHALDSARKYFPLVGMNAARDVRVKRVDATQTCGWATHRY